jgi:transglutaminase-like putative cysteine protease
VPGYLRGYVYRDYMEGQWRSSDEGGLLRSLPKENGHITFSVFQRWPPPPKDRAERMDILPADGFQSRVLMAPGDTSRIEVISGELRNSSDGELGIGKWEAETGYVAVVPKILTDPAYPEPSGEALKAANYLGVPGYLRDSLGPTAKEVFAGVPDEAPFEQQCATLIAYFRTHFRYELGVQMDMYAGDPVVQFLDHWKRGHCELFAASTALLLRLRGIPARYVTGFVCMEQPPGAGHYVSRLQDAHAWVEAYNKENDRWELVEATPPSGVPHGGNRTSLLWSLFDSLRMAWQRTLALMKRGYIAQALATLFLGAVSALVALVATPLRAAVTVAMLGALMVWALRRSRRRALAQINELGAGRWRLRRARSRLFREFRRAGIEIAPGDTLRHLLARLASGGAQETAAALAPAIGEYERLRYGPEPPSREEAKAFEARLRRGLPRR